MSQTVVSFIIATHNRVATLLHTLERIDACGLRRSEYEILVVDNASCDGTVERLTAQRPDVCLFALDRNRGSCAKADALARVRGRYVVFLDDDAYPLDGSIEAMVEHFGADPRLGAAGFTVHLPGGERESAALPHVFVGCGVGFRREALLAAGGLDRSFFMQAEEYDLSFRLVQAGFRVDVYADLHVLHLKTPAARQTEHRVYYDTRNNLILAATYLPDPWHRRFLEDWSQRYGWLAEQLGARQAYEDGRFWGFLKGYWRRLSRPDRRLDEETLETFFGFKTIAEHIAGLKREGFGRLLFADLGKNVYPYYHAAREQGLEILAILDDRFAAAGRRYRGVPIVGFNEGLGFSAEAIVVSNASSVHAEITERRLRRETSLPIYNWLRSRGAGSGAWSRTQSLNGPLVPRRRDSAPKCTP